MSVSAANADAHKGEMQAQVRKKLLDAENAISARVMLREIALKALEVAPELTRELMSPAKAISEIKVLQTSGIGAQGVSASGTAPALGAMSPVLKTVLEAGAAYPLMRELMSFAQVDKNQLTEKAKTALGEIRNELGGALEPAPSTSSNGVSHVEPGE